MVGSLIVGLLCAAIICGLALWVTNKAYSKKWDQDDQDKF